MQDAGLIHERRSATRPPFSEQEQHLKCPRCDSTNTKFCYYNNYNMSQPRHFCKNCRRYWTKGGSLRNIPVGGGSRKNSKRPSTSASKAKSAGNSTSPPPSSFSSLLEPETDHSGIYCLPPAATDHDRRLLDITGTFSSLLASNGQLGALCDPMGKMQGTLKSAVPAGWSLPEYSEGTVAMNYAGLDLIADGNGDGILGESGGWVGGNWPDLAMYTPGSSFQ